MPRKVYIPLSELQKTPCWELNKDRLTQGKPSKMKALPKNNNSKAKSRVAWTLKAWCVEKGLVLVPEHQFDEERKYRFDWAIKEKMIAVEFEGGVFQKGTGHNSAKHYTKDTDKYNLAQSLGWRVVRVTAMNYKTLIEQLEKFL